MHYVSPIKLLQEELNLETAEITVRELSLIKRKLMAEAELNDNKTVIRGGVEFSKEDIIRLFDDLEKNLCIDFHRKIFNNKPLLVFLETGVYDFAEAAVNVAEIKADTQYKDFIQPWFIAVWNEAMLHELRYRQFYNLCILMQLGHEVIDEFLLPEIMQPFEAKLWDFEASAKLQSEQIKNKTEDVDETDMYISDELIIFFNQLPYTLSGFRNHYMIAMVNITVQLFNTGRRKRAISYGTMAMKLESDDFYKNQMAERLQLYKSKRSPTATSPGRGAFRYLWIAVFIISIVARVGSCNNNGSPGYSNSFSNTINSISPSTVTATKATHNEQQFYLYRDDNGGTENDSAIIAFVTRDRGNALFLRGLVKLLQKNIDTLAGKEYPKNYTANYDVPAWQLPRAIDSGWQKDYEENSLITQNARAIIYNNTTTPVLLLYKYGTHLESLSITPGNFGEVEFQPGYTFIAPFFGMDWNKDKKIYRVTKDGKTVLSYGWFTAKSGPVKSSKGNLTMLKIDPNEPYADTIRFNYIPGYGYASTLVGDNIQMANRIPSL